MEQQIEGRIDVRQVAASATYNSAATVNTAAVDCLGYESMAFLIDITDATDDTGFEVEIQGSDDGSTGWEAINSEQPATDAGNPTVLTHGALDASAVGVVVLGSASKKRYQRLAITSTVASDITARVLAILGHPKNAS